MLSAFFACSVVRFILFATSNYKPSLLKRLIKFLTPLYYLALGTAFQCMALTSTASTKLITSLTAATATATPPSDIQLMTCLGRRTSVLQTISCIIQDILYTLLCSKMASIGRLDTTSPLSSHVLVLSPFLKLFVTECYLFNPFFQLSYLFFFPALGQSNSFVSTLSSSFPSVSSSVSFLERVLLSSSSQF